MENETKNRKGERLAAECTVVVLKRPPWFLSAVFWGVNLSDSDWVTFMERTSGLIWLLISCSDKIQQITAKLFKLPPHHLVFRLTFIPSKCIKHANYIFYFWYSVTHMPICSSNWQTLLEPVSVPPGSWVMCSHLRCLPIQLETQMPDTKLSLTSINARTQSLNL